MKFSIATECRNHRRRYSNDRTGYRLRRETRKPAHRPEFCARAGPRHRQSARTTLRPIFCCGCSNINRYFSTIVLMVQKEVAESPGRLAWKPRLRLAFGDGAALWPGRANSSRFLPQRFLHLRKFIRSRGSYYDQASAEVARVSEAEFIAFLKLCFGQKRKTLWNNLKTRYDEDALRAALAKSGVKPAIRARSAATGKNRPALVPRAARRQFIASLGFIFASRLFAGEGSFGFAQGGSATRGPLSARRPVKMTSRRTNSGRCGQVLSRPR